MEKNGVQNPSLQSQIYTVILAIGTLSIQDGRVTLNVCPPVDELITASSSAISKNRTYIRTLRYTNNAKDFITVQAPVKTANSLHPLVEECLIVSNTDALSEFANSFVPCIVDMICSKKQERSFAKPDRWMKYSAHCYFAVDWSKYQNSQLKPPYKVWLENNKILEITENDMQRWRDSKIKNMD